MTPATAGSGGTPRTTARVHVVVSFYPLQWAVERVGGARVDVLDLTKPGAEPHDLELTPQEVAAVADASLIAYLSGFQPAVDKAVQAVGASARALDVRDAARLTLTVEDEERPGVTIRDPHFWLDPTRLADVVDLVARRLAAVDPAGEAGYQDGARSARADLEALDGELRAGLARCSSSDLVTSHEAFGYLAQRYGLHQVGIAGLSPDQEPSPKSLARVSDYVRSHGVRTIYYETLVPADIARTVAGATGARTAVLDPIEGLSDASAARDYLALMRADLAALRQGQPCG